MVSLCPVCHSPGYESLLTVAGIPVFCNKLWADAAAARTAPRGDITLSLCPHCLHLFNASFDPTLLEYDEAYENSLKYSSTFQAYIGDLSHQLVDKFHLQGKQLVEIGAGQGDFLEMLCSLGENTGIGFDPSYRGDKAWESPAGRIRIIADYYSSKYSDIKGDFYISRQVLEHLPEPRAFMRDFRSSLGLRFSTNLFIEVPNVLYTLADLGIWDLIYEHFSYFSELSLKSLLELAGFEVIDVYGAYGSQFLCIEARPAQEPREPPGMTGPSGETADRIMRLAAAFADVYTDKVSAWKERLYGFDQHANCVVVWGAGSKGITFANIFQEIMSIEALIDINPRKHGMFAAGTGTPILPTAALPDLQPDTVVVMNPLYQDEVRQELSRLSLDPRILQA